MDQSFIHMDKSMIFRNPKRPPAGGTANGIRPRRYDYWRTGYNEEQPGELAFWVAQAGEYHCKPGYFTGDFEHANRTQFFYHLTGDAAFYCVDHPTPVQMGDLLIIPPRT
ncbi:MAG: hypothetical protein ACE5GO_05115, partial [Anaerolineales bacterium]